MKKRIITIAGKPGSGKSSTANRIAQLLGYARYSSGDFMRRIAQKRNMKLGELQRYAETHPDIDYEIDEENRRAGEKNNLVIDARLAWYFIPESFKVYLELDMRVCAERIFFDASHARKASGEVTESIEELERLLQERLASEQARYQKLYHVNHLDLTQYDLVVNTGNIPLEEVAQHIVSEYQKWLAH